MEKNNNLIKVICIKSESIINLLRFYYLKKNPDSEISNDYEILDTELNSTGYHIATKSIPKYFKEIK